MSYNSFNYKQFWESNYKHNGNSGAGSYGVLAQFKSEIVNSYIDKYDIYSTIEFGCGDGNQISYMNYKNYIGFDVAPSSIKLCQNKFKNDSTKNFYAYDPLTFDSSPYKADLVVCLDVLYHITYEEDYIKTLDHIFNCSKKLVILYTTLTNTDPSIFIPTIQNRNIKEYLDKYSDFKIKEIVEQRYKRLSGSHFIILEKL